MDAVCPKTSRMDRACAPWLDPPLGRVESRRGNRRVQASRGRRLFASRERVRCVADAAATRPGRCRGPWGPKGSRASTGSRGSKGAPRPALANGQAPVSSALTGARREPTPPERFGAQALLGSPMMVDRSHRASRDAALRRRPGERRPRRRAMRCARMKSPANDAVPRRGDVILTWHGG